MNKKIFILLVICLFALPLYSAFATESFIQPTEMLQWNPDKCYNGYTAFTLGDGTRYLIDMEGQVVKAFEPIGNNPGSGYWQMLENGNMRSCIAAITGLGGYGGGPGPGIEEVDWNGNLLWRWVGYDGTGTADNTMRQHHDYRKIYNKALGEYTYLALCWIKKSADDAAKLGTSFATKAWSPCALIEIRPKWGQIETGIPEIVWFWTFADHFVTKTDSASKATTLFTDSYGRPKAPATLVGPGETLANYPNRLNIDGVHYTVAAGVSTDMEHCNSFDYDEATGHICINAKACNEFFAIDHDGTFVGGGATGYDAAGALTRTSAGDFLYRFGNPANYEAGDPAGWFDEGDMEMYGSHNIEFIDPYHWRPPVLAGDNWPAPTASVALPGGGALNPNGRSNFMIYDNGCYNPVSRLSKVLEINPYIMDGDGNLSSSYVDPGPFQEAGLPRRTQVPWEFFGTEADFYSLHISGAHRLPNGNTIVCAGRKGHFFEVTADKEVVWEYVAPYRSRATISGPAGITPYLGQGDDSLNSVFRCTRYGPDYPGLAGKDLTPQGTLTGRIPLGIGGGDVYPAPVTYTGFGFPAGGVTVGEGSGAGGGGEGGGGSGY